jgi:hypothetical protein
MKRTKADIERLAAELQRDCSLLDELLEANSRAYDRIRNGASDSLDYGSLGYTIHNIYGVIENACLRIAKFFENGFSQDAWHKELLNRMLLDLPNMRPAFLTQEAYIVLDELRAFRHVFRNLYSRPLDFDRLMLVQKKTPRAVTLVKESVNRYVSFLAKLADSIEE